MNTRFAVATHVLTLLATFPDEALTSEAIAGSVQTNPVVIRRILGTLREAGFVSALQGPGGGFVLAVEPDAVSLREVYEAVAGRNVIAVHDAPNRRCPVGKNIGALLDGVVAKAEQAMLDSLGRVTVGALVKKVAKCEKAS
jgi:Rrf2 family protein